MYRVVSNITITQHATRDYPNRSKVINLDFLTSYEVDSTWKNFTDKGTITIPKNLYYVDKNGKKQPLYGTAVNAGGFDSDPLFLRGDQIVLEVGYKDVSVNTIFEGYISKVHSGIPVTFDVEDNMWILKQTALDPVVFTASDTLEDILQYIVDAANSQHGTSLTVNSLQSTNMGTFMVSRETGAQVLQRLEKAYGLQSYFRGSELRCGAKIYVESEAVKHVFKFQQNIIEDELEYQRKDDIVLSAIAHNTITENTGGTTKDGHPKTKRTRIEVLVTMNDRKPSGYDTLVLQPGQAVPENIEGERRTFFFPGATTSDELAALAYEQLKKYFYTGMKGSFTTFGIPHVKFGDNVQLSDSVLPERNGLYRVRQVEPFGGANVGLRQIIHLDYRIS